MKTIIEKYPVTAILRNVPEDVLIDYLESLYQGGLRSFEISFSAPDAPAQLRRAKGAMPKDLLIGAGTILTVEDAKMAQQAGADFMLSPSTNPPVLSYCADQKIRFLPGVFSPTDVSICLEHGFRTLKLFPAGDLPLSYVKSLKGPFPDTEYVAVGGVSPANALSYFKAGYIGAGIGSSLVSPEDFAKRNWKAITASIRTFLDSLKKERIL